MDLGYVAVRVSYGDDLVGDGCAVFDAKAARLGGLWGVVGHCTADKSGAGHTVSRFSCVARVPAAGQPDCCRQACDGGAWLRASDLLAVDDPQLFHISSRDTVAVEFSV